MKPTGSASILTASDVMVQYMSRYTTEKMTALDRLMRSSKSLLSRKQAFYAEQEQALFATLCEVWRRGAAVADGLGPHDPGLPPDSVIDPVEETGCPHGVAEEGAEDHGERLVGDEEIRV